MTEIDILADGQPPANEPKAPRVPYGNQFHFGFNETEVPSQFCRVAESLTDLVINGYGSQWGDASDAEHIVIQREALAFMRRALDEVEVILDYSAARAADHFRAELARLEKGAAAQNNQSAQA